LHTLSYRRKSYGKRRKSFSLSALRDSRDDLTEGLEEIVSKAVAQRLKIDILLPQHLKKIFLKYLLKGGNRKISEIKR
jgi:hypothetical protein